MTKIKGHLSAIPVVVSGVVVALILFVLWTSRANTVERTAGEGSAIATKPTAPQEATGPLHAVPAETPAVAPPTAQDNPALLDRPRQYALAMIESGTDDRAVGGIGEVGRYQIMPSVWKHYNLSRDYQDPAVSLEVARQHWASLYDYFKKKTNREPTDFDMYVLWNTRHGYYASKGFNPARLHPVVSDRAQRFSNLVELGVRREAEIAGGKRT